MKIERAATNLSGRHLDVSRHRNDAFVRSCASREELRLSKSRNSEPNLAQVD